MKRQQIYWRKPDNYRPTTANRSDSFLRGRFNYTIQLVAQGQHRKVQTGALANDCENCELNADASGQAAFPHLEAGVSIASLDGPADSVIPDIHDSVPADKYTVKKSNELEEGIKEQPLDQGCSESNDNESDVQPYE